MDSGETRNPGDVVGGFLAQPVQGMHCAIEGSAGVRLPAGRQKSDVFARLR